MENLDPSHAATLTALARCLTHLYVRAGMPPLRELEQQTGRAAGKPLGASRLKSVRLGRTSLNEVLNGRKFPRKAFLLTFVEACGIDLMTDLRWEEAWNRLALQSAHEVTSKREDFRHQIAEFKGRALRAEAENNRLRQQVTELSAQARRAEAENSRLRHQAAFGRYPEQVRVTSRSQKTAPQLERKSLISGDPEQIGPYAVLGRLGSGSMGQVFLGRSASGRLVAVKTIRPELAEEAGFRTRFAQEVAAARKVSGVFTAAVVEADPDADLPWLATAYVPAPSLSRLVLACGPLPADSVRWLAAGCAEALASIHGTGLVHRDLKPSNVLVAPDGPRVIDFGVARAAERMGWTTARGTVGTPAYMAPEQARDTREASVASDVYSLGATLLFAATGHLPYAGATVTDVLARLATEEPDLSGLPGELSELIAGCLDRVPRNRPTSTAIMVQLGDFTVAQAGPDEDHAYLPAAAMALIGEYQRSPQYAAAYNETSDDATSASEPSLP
jgi:serine/threonine protein kinase